MRRPLAESSTGVDTDAALKALIAAIDLLENLNVRTDEPGEDGAEHFAVVAGGRRLKALQELAADGVIDPDHPVPCQMTREDVEPREISLAENVIRIAMHPADQVVAFSKLVQAGQSVAAIAARFGVSERVVEQRLRLGNAAPELLDTYRAATGATTVPGLAYAGRLGLWAAGETPFENRAEFISAMEAGGVAAMEVVARDLKALGLYQARALAYEGVEVDILEHPLTPEQRRIYDAYAGAFKIIHQNIEEALKATGIVQGEDTLNRNAKSAALSAFEGTKQRFFGHLLTGMKCPSLIRAVEADLDGGRSAVVQLVSTGEALMERRIAEIPASEWDDLNIDLTPRDGILSFLMHAFPVQLQEPFTYDDGNLMSWPATDAEGNPVICREAEAQRDALIEKLAALPPVPTALDQVV